MTPLSPRVTVVALLASALLATAPLAQVETPQPDERRPPEPLPVVTGTKAELFVPRELDGIIAAKSVPAGIRRESLDPVGEAELAFEAVPGGIVFGRVATSANDWSGARLAYDAARGLFVTTGSGVDVALPPAEPSLLAAVLAFTSKDASGEWLVDIGADGEVRLAPELTDSAAGLVAVRADLLPQFYLPMAVGSKSVIVDRDVRFALDPSGTSVRFEADLEIRFYRPEFRPGDEDVAERVGTIALDCSAADGRPRLSAPEGRGLSLIAERLPDAAQLAGWVGFFRWAAANELDGLDAVRVALAADESPRVRTPRRILERDRPSWIFGAGAAPPGEVAEWMNEHRERKLRELREQRERRERR
jgi:hypothetical protein